MLILHQLPAFHWAIGGAGVAVLTLLLLVFANKRLGLSTGFESVCSLVVKLPYFRRPELLGSNRWRLAVVLGLVLGGAASAMAGGGWAPTWNLGMFDTRIGWGPAGKLAWMFAGGLLVGMGTRMAGGCTSGHGIFGLSNLELPSLKSTLSFMAAGTVASNVIYRLIWVG